MIFLGRPGQEESHDQVSRYVRYVRYVLLILLIHLILPVTRSQPEAMPYSWKVVVDYEKVSSGMNIVKWYSISGIVEQCSS